MSLHLKQSTAVVVQFGPFLDKADGLTLLTGLVSALDNGTTGIKLAKNGGTLTIRHATVTATTYDAHGCYKITLDTTDTNTLGTVRMIYTDATTCLPVWQDFMVLPANVWDSLYGSDALQVDLVQIDGALTSGNNATLNLKQLNIVNSTGSAVIASATGSNGHGITASGNGSGDGVRGTGGATGNGVNGVGGATSGAGGRLQGTTSSAGLYVQGAGAYAGLLASGGATGPGIALVGGATSGDGLFTQTTLGHGINLTATGTDKHGLLTTGGNGGTSDGLKAVAGTGGVPIRGDLTGNITGTITTATNVTTVNGLAANVITATSIAADAITDAKVASDVTIASVTGAVGSVTGAVGSVTAGVTVATNNDKTGYGLSATAVQAIWDAATAALTTVGSIGKYLLDHLVGILWTGTHVAQTGDSFARLGAPAGPSVSADVADLPTNAELATALASADDAVLAAIAALNNLAAGAAMTLTAGERTAIADAMRARQLTESYAADTVAPTLEQSLFRIMQNLTQFAIAGTTITVKKLDKSTTAETYTLDSSTVPTSRTRAT